MSKLHLVIGNKNYSSWSLRPWIALTMAKIPFTETIILLDRPDTARKIAAHSRAGRIPVLHHGKVTVWDSLAILEYVAELYPDRHLWPKNAAARAMARAVANEMHAGFSALRNACP
ncbi:MAG: glutathione S-transferase, partial [Alphaproteobacteria bacterium]|nr:glutathione S-transferase [Alphaproteobacteria bacterium]